MKRLGYYATINEIDRVSRIAKSNYVITEWIVRGKKWESKLKKRRKNRKQYFKLQSYYKKKHEAIEQMINTGMLSVKIYKPSEDSFYWLYVFEQEMNGLKLTVVAPYDEFKEIARIEERFLDETDIHEDSLTLNGKKIVFAKQEAFSFKFIMENLEKSRKKLISKMEENK